MRLHATAVVGVMTLLALVALGAWLWHNCMPRIPRAEAEQVALATDPYTFADATLAYIKCNGRPPDTILECLAERTADMELPAADEYGQIMFELPYGVVKASRTLTERCLLAFPARPSDLAVVDGALVEPVSGTRARLLSVAGAPEEILEEVNIALYGAWKALAARQSTGVRWLDEYRPGPVTQSRQVQNVGRPPDCPAGE